MISMSQAELDDQADQINEDSSKENVDGAKSGQSQERSLNECPQHREIMPGGVYFISYEAKYKAV